MIDRQADDFLPQGVLNVLGAAKIHVQRTQFVLSIFNTVSIAVTVFFTSPISSVHVPLFGRPWTSVYAWLATVMLVAVAYLVVDRVLLYPAEVSYNSHQSSRRDRNPGYDVTVDSNERIRRIEEQLHEQNLVETDGGQDEGD